MLRFLLVPSPSRLVTIGAGDFERERKKLSREGVGIVDVDVVAIVVSDGFDRRESVDTERE